jgi:hypothetical protein
MTARIESPRVVPWALRCLILAAVLFAADRPACAQSEDGVKAAFLYNFAKFTEWPGAAFADASAKITVGFVGGTALADTFSQAITGKNANGREFDVKKLGGAADATGCHIVFVGDAGQAGAVVVATKGKPVLTVGEGDSFTGAGGMIGFIKDGAKVVFELNLEPAGAAGLKVDAKLKGVAKSVKGG